MDTASGQDAPRVLPLPVGITAPGTRTERDSLGTVEVCDCPGVEVRVIMRHGSVARSVMMVTVLSPVTGYDKASAIAHLAVRENLALKQAALASGVSEERYDEVVVPERLTRPGSAGAGAGS